jgi:hypothetical protein
MKHKLLLIFIIVPFLIFFINYSFATEEVINYSAPTRITNNDNNLSYARFK